MAQPPPYYQQGYNPTPKKGLPVWALSLIIFAGIVIPGIVIVLIISAMPSVTVTHNPDAFDRSTAGAAAQATYASSTTVIAPAAKPKAAIGDTLRADGYAVTVNAVERSVDFTSSGIGKAKPGYTNLALDVTIQSEKDSGVSVNFFYCHVKDSDGYAYELNVAGKTPSLGSQNDLAKGDKARGWVTFAAREGATGLVFEYTPFNSSAKFQIKLDR